MTWYALRTTNRQEPFVVMALAEAGLLGYSPQHITKAEFAKRKATRSRPLIPGYVFAKLPDDDAIQAAYGLRGVVRNSSIRLRPLDVGALILFEACHAFDETWEPPKTKGRRYAHAWKAGDKVRIINGPAAGHVGTVLGAKGRERMEVLLTLFGRPWEVETEHRNLELAQHVAVQRAA